MNLPVNCPATPKSASLACPSILRRIFPAFLVKGLLLMVMIIIVQEFRVDVQLFHAHPKVKSALCHAPTLLWLFHGKRVEKHVVNSHLPSLKGCKKCTVQKSKHRVWNAYTLLKNSNACIFHFFPKHAEFLLASWISSTIS